jgi:hypothetical protein
VNYATFLELPGQTVPFFFCLCSLPFASNRSSFVILHCLRTWLTFLDTLISSTDISYFKATKATAKVTAYTPFFSRVLISLFQQNGIGCVFSRWSSIILNCFCLPLGLPAAYRRTRASCSRIVSGNDPAGERMHGRMDEWELGTMALRPLAVLLTPSLPINGIADR